MEGSCNYAFTLVLREPDVVLRDRIMTTLRSQRSSSGAARRAAAISCGSHISATLVIGCVAAVSALDHVHFFGFYIGNYPTLEQDKILQPVPAAQRTGSGDTDGPATKGSLK